MIPKNELEVGCKYYCYARNFSIGLWNGSRFEYTRNKFGVDFNDTEFHYKDGPPYGTVTPIKKVDDGTT